ncbi:MAG: alpha/beta fold hydrolase [Acidobacteriaceae bacterium]|nr:alpha/beta fold hydrolase [Acidobacteriaceae bacterium]
MPAALPGQSVQSNSPSYITVQVRANRRGVFFFQFNKILAVPSTCSQVFEARYPTAFPLPLKMLRDHLRIVYLHGFASSPASRKANFFLGCLEAAGQHVHVPDLEQGDFEHLTISRQLSVLEEIACGEPVILIGSSMGGYLAALYAARHPEVDRLILLAPAFGLYQLWVEQLGPERIAEWKRNGTRLFFHYAAQRELPLGYQLLEDASRFEPFPDVHQPVLIFHGTEDSTVPVQQSLAFVQAHPNALLLQMKSGHELTDVLPTIWEESRIFLIESVALNDGGARL